MLVIALKVVCLFVQTKLQGLDKEGDKGATKLNVVSALFSDGATVMLLASGELELNGGYLCPFEVRDAC